MVPVLLRENSASVASSTSTPITDTSISPSTRSSSYVQVIRPDPYGGTSTSFTNVPTGSRITASRRRPGTGGLASSGLAGSPAGAALSGGAGLAAAPGSPVPFRSGPLGSADAHCPTTNPINPVATIAAATASLSFFQTMARTAPSVNVTVRPDTPSEVNDSPAATAFAARTVTHTHAGSTARAPGP